jgi:hypothetical protein
MNKLKGLLYGIAYGLAMRGFFVLEFGDHRVVMTNGLMSISFLFFVPFVIGLLVAYYNTTLTSSSKVMELSMPLLAVVGFVVTTVLLGSEGIICAIMALPIFAFMSLLGGYLGTRIFYRNKDKTMISFMLFIPFLAASVESFTGLSDQLFTEHTTITIRASDEKVWKHITRVSEIGEQENRLSLFQLMGFPRPIRAELDTIAVGGVRLAVFDRGLIFTETVTQVIPRKELTFTIEANPASIPPTALDKHVLVGGQYFDILDGKYEMEKISEQEIRLHLTSRFRLATHFNFYSGFWSQLIMSDIQQNILRIVKDRSEKE